MTLRDAQRKQDEERSEIRFDVLPEVGLKPDKNGKLHFTQVTYDGGVATYTRYAIDVRLFHCMLTKHKEDNVSTNRNPSRDQTAYGPVSVHTGKQHAPVPLRERRS